MPFTGTVTDDGQRWWCCCHCRTQRHRAGMQVRRTVLGETHVDRAVARTTDFSRRFQDHITLNVWGDVWTRPGLARRDRSIGVLSVLAALGLEDELRMHVRAALRNGLTRDEIGEVLLQVGVYAGVPRANGAFAVASVVFAESAQDSP